MLILNNAVFLHVPKTGGSWIKAAITNAGIDYEEHLVDGDPHGDLSYCPCRDRFTFAFVRDPLSLYRSYWRFKMGQFRMTTEWDCRNPFDVACAAPTFTGFVENVLRLEPAWCSRAFEDYVGPPTREIDFVGRFEYLMADLVRALYRSRTPFDERAIRNTPPINVSTVDAGLAQWSDALAQRVRRSEQDAILRFGYC
jgi:hypothetical protein